MKRPLFAVPLLLALAESASSPDRQAQTDSAWRARALTATAERDRECPEFKPWEAPSLYCALLDAYARYEIKRLEDGRFVFVMTVAAPNGGSLLRLRFIYRDGVPMGVEAASHTSGLSAIARTDGWFVVSWVKADGKHVSLHVDPFDPYHIKMETPAQPTPAMQRLLSLSSSSPPKSNQSQAPLQRR